MKPNAVRLPETTTLASVGEGHCIGHYGELFQGQIEDERGRPHRCLVSLPCHRLYSQVSFRPSMSGVLDVHPAHKVKARRAVELALASSGFGGVGGTIRIHSNIEEGKGCGSSTSDCVAAIRAVASAMGLYITAGEIAALVVEAETASDNVMFHNSVLFAQREGRVLEDYGQPLPALAVLGIDTGGAVDTLDYPPAEYQWRDRQRFLTFAGALRRGIRMDDKELLGRVALASAECNECALPKPFFWEMRDAALAAGALGLSVAHSGTVASALFHPLDPCLERRMGALMNTLDSLGLGGFFRFSTSPEGIQQEAA